MNYKEIQKSAFYQQTYAKIEELKKGFPVNHGFLHINHVISNAKKLAKEFALSNKQKRLLYVACALHDIGYLEGREDHATSGAKLAKPYLESLGFKQEEINTICNAIASHSGKDKQDYTDPVSRCLVLADKLDFVGSRYNDKLKDYPISPMYKAIIKLDFKLSDKIVLNFYTKPAFTKQEFETCHLGKKLQMVFSTLSELLNKPYTFVYHQV